MTPQFRFTFFHPIYSASGTVVKEPIGWKEAAISLERDSVFHSLIEYFKGTFTWIGSARTFLNAINNTYGPEEPIRCLIEITYNGTTWATLFDGNIDNSQRQELSNGGKFYKLTAPIIRNDLWTKFMSRKSIPIDATSTEDLDGGTRTAVNPIELDLPSQVIRLNYDGVKTRFKNILDSFISLNQFIQIDFEKEILNTVSKINVATEVIPTNDPIQSILKAPYDGDYEFNIRVESWCRDITGITTIPSDDYVRWFIQVNEDAATELSFTNYGTAGNESTVYNYSDTLILKATDNVRIYGKCIQDLTPIGGTPSYFIVSTETSSTPSGEGGEDNPPTYLTIQADTTFADSVTDAYKIKDAFESILSKIVGANSVLTSSYLDTCVGYNAIMKGLHARGYLMTTKKPFWSFDDLWNGYAHIYPLGLTYNGSNIQIENRDYFYNKSPVLFFQSSSNIEKKVHLDKYYKSIEIGFNKWSAESESGVDDPQTKHTYRTPFKTVGKDEKVLSTFIAASLAIEQTRRNRVEAGKDWKLDEDTLIIALKSDDTVETGADFNSVTDLLNSDTRYNVRHGVARIFNRWKSWFQGCLQKQVGGDIKFTKGEGNYTMTSENASGECEEQIELSENQDFEITDSFIHLGDEFKVTVPMRKASYDTILANRENAVAIPVEGQWFACHILNFDWKIMKGECELICLLADDTALESVSLLLETGEAMLLEDGNSILLE